MKQLIWKELREQRFVPLICSVLLMLCIVFESMTQGWEQDVKWAAQDHTSPMFSWVLAAILASTLSFSAEFGNRTITFLTALPIGYSRIWSAKVFAGLITIIVSMLCTMAVWIIAFRVVFGVIHVFPFVPGETGTYDANGWHWVADGTMLSRYLVTALLTALACYGIGLVVSPITDRVIVSLMASSVGCFGLPAVAKLISDQYPLGTDYRILEAVIQLFYCLLFPLTLWASHAIFTKGHTFRPTPRFYQEVRGFFGWIGAIMLAARAGYMLLHLGL